MPLTKKPIGPLPLLLDDVGRKSRLAAAGLRLAELTGKDAFTATVEEGW